MATSTARKALHEYPKVDPAENVTLKGLAVLASFFTVFIALYAASYPLGQLASPVLGPGFGSTSSVMYLALAAAGLALVIRYRKGYRANDVIVPLGLAALVWLAVQAKYWNNGWVPAIPYYPPTFAAAQVFLMALGAIGLLKAKPLLRFRLAENDDRGAAAGLGLGALLGLPFAAINVLLFIFSSGEPIVVQDVLTASILALQAGIVEEIAYRLLFMGLAMAILLRYLPKRVAIGSALFMSIAFHSAIHVPGLLLSSPVMAVTTMAVLSLLFGLPMALLAYKKDIETAIGFHWAIDAVRFSLGF
jgi:hypothetical protein